MSKVGKVEFNNMVGRKKKKLKQNSTKTAAREITKKIQETDALMAVRKHVLKEKEKKETHKSSNT